jgi:hypothetical protein
MLIAPFFGRREKLYQGSMRERDVVLGRMHPTSTKSRAVM